MLTKLDIAAMRKANHIVFAHREGNSQIRAVKQNRASERDPFACEMTHEIACGFELRDYSEGDAHIAYEACQQGLFNAFEMIHVAQSEEAWQTIASLLREGDALILQWSRNGLTTEAARDVHFFGDSLSLLVKRGDKRLVFKIRSQFGPDNSARMVKVAFAQTRAGAALLNA